MAETRAQLNRKVRQEALREQLEAQGHLQHISDIATKLADLGQELSTTEVQRLFKAAEIKAKLVNKYLPDTKQVEVSSDPDNPLEMKWTVEVTSAKDQHT